MSSNVSSYFNNTGQTTFGNPSSNQMYNGYTQTPKLTTDPTVASYYQGGGVPIGNEYANAAKNLGIEAKEAWQGASTLGKLQGLGQTAQGIFNAYNSYKANKMAKEQFKFNKMESNRNYEAQKGITNSQLADRQAARVARNPGQFASVSEYMNKYGVK